MRRSLRMVSRGVVAASVAIKLLVPVGYMPAAIADGGPIRLCDSGPAGAIASARGAGNNMPAHQTGDHAHGHAHGHADGHGHDQGHALADGADQAEKSDRAPERIHDHDQPGASHHDWERCYLGGLSSLAAVSTDWHFFVPTLRPAAIATVDREFVVRLAVIAFRPRGPPITHT
jgi:hypothetical protein